MLAWIDSIFNRRKSSTKLNKNVPQDEDWMLVDTNLKSISEAEHDKAKLAEANNKTTLYTLNSKNNKTATTMAAIGLGQKKKSSVADNDLSLLKDKVGMAGINLTGFSNIQLNEKLKESTNNNTNDILLAMRDKEQKMKKDKKLMKRTYKA
ncbi:hypothetical protein H8356DRAFT_1722985 [Neocallimastix lanati (nom. inval.)]|jgi:hypothetical protein|uniref:Uncharacterized protein n=1 Tax=Neocallimastix californiae TaxID=1754190 RepID=A0A1Y2CRR6_9FUNG|nr:hypothetical protein H8356DRAFT_1722985 [Neocallimastix sp. JGI-2020a]ORY49711.1 hypothetical protein LY90DRAFT_703039 [Neocallimastix californiae]|eukprot:ORY49711.1 hypothetical protein LY90DRAFT_703039 [Neocallimastix californiae]